MTEPIAPLDEPSQPGRSPWRAITVLVAVLALMLFAFPAAVLDWVAERCPEGPVCEAAIAAAGAIEDASGAVGVAPFAEDIRTGVRSFLGIDGY